jgi:hypothetical protein
MISKAESDGLVGFVLVFVRALYRVALNNKTTIHSIEMRTLHGAEKIIDRFILAEGGIQVIYVGGRPAAITSDNSCNIRQYMSANELEEELISIENTTYSDTCL